MDDLKAWSGVRGSRLVTKREESAGGQVIQGKRRIYAGGHTCSGGTKHRASAEEVYGCWSIVCMMLMPVRRGGLDCRLTNILGELSLLAGGGRRYVLAGEERDELLGALPGARLFVDDHERLLLRERGQGGGRGGLDLVALEVKVQDGVWCVDV